MSQVIAPTTTDTAPSALWRLLRRISRGAISICCTLLGLAALTFFIGRLLPIDPVVAVIGDNASHEAYEKMYEQLGLNQPLWKQFVDYVWQLLHRTSAPR